ncbi:MAG: hypothetical protein KGH94_01665 [Candidatus Micrarchaeota archaeon]|nr:hypothetical protein [Candidatus Micrarchaeota archaeon]
MPVLFEIVFIALAILSVGGALLVFRAREMSHAMIGFLAVAVSGAGLMAVLGLPLLSLLQLFIMVGGISTYLFVGVSSENLSRFRHTSLPLLVALAVLLSAVPVYRIISIGPVGTTAPSALGSASLSSLVSSNIALFYMLAVLLFGIGLASIIVMKEARKGARS